MSNEEINVEELEKVCDSAEKIRKNPGKILVWGFLVLLALLIYLIFGLKYTLVASGDNIYRINRITGDVQLIKGTRFIKIDKCSHFDRLGLSKFRKLDEITIPKHNLKCNLEISWRNDNLYYNFSVSPYNAPLKKVREGGYFESVNKGFNIELYDDNGFVIAEIPVKINEMTAVVDDNNNPAELSMKGRISMSYEDIKLLKNWSTTWNF